MSAWRPYIIGPINTSNEEQATQLCNAYPTVYLSTVTINSALASRGKCNAWSSALVNSLYLPYAKQTNKHGKGNAGVLYKKLCLFDAWPITAILAFVSGKQGCMAAFTDPPDNNIHSQQVYTCRQQTTIKASAATDNMNKLMLPTNRLKWASLLWRAWKIQTEFRPLSASWLCEMIWHRLYVDTHTLKVILKYAMPCVCVCVSPTQAPHNSAHSSFLISSYANC